MMNGRDTPPLSGRPEEGLIESLLIRGPAGDLISHYGRFVQRNDFTPATTIRPQPPSPIPRTGVPRGPPHHSLCIMYRLTCYR
jgi:hypothetical protein